ncbi:hypothetical protein Hypma_006171 [Hypsizygus marmoreus]|uniref:Uncharacterized protein n=1 Tax=Hypsizygus marmoreus TaxID=39966 RepID=A0A369JTA8_HYPMA|nr:hypothetical protein Hypma_006171 [Hypsizygus marmoreus]
MLEASQHTAQADPETQNACRVTDDFELLQLSEDFTESSTSSILGRITWISYQQQKYLTRTLTNWDPVLGATTASKSWYQLKTSGPFFDERDEGFLELVDWAEYGPESGSLPFLFDITDDGFEAGGAQWGGK